MNQSSRLNCLLEKLNDALKNDKCEQAVDAYIGLIAINMDALKENPGCVDNINAISYFYDQFEEFDVTCPKSYFATHDYRLKRQVDICKRLITLYEDLQKARPDDLNIMDALRLLYDDLSRHLLHGGSIPYDQHGSLAQTRKAIDITKKIIDKTHNNTEMKFNLAELYQTLGDHLFLPEQKFEKLQNYESSLEIAYKIYSPELYLKIRELKIENIYYIDRFLQSMSNELLNELSYDIINKFKANSSFIRLAEPSSANFAFSIGSEALCVELDYYELNDMTSRFPSAMLICGMDKETGIRIHKNDLDISYNLIKSLDNEKSYIKYADIANKFLSNCNNVKNLNKEAKLTNRQLMEVYLLAGCAIVGERYDPSILMSNAKAMMCSNSARVSLQKSQGSLISTLQLAEEAHKLSLLSTREVFALGL